MPWITLKFAQPCAECGDDIFEGDSAYFNGKAYCKVCGEDEHLSDQSVNTKPLPKTKNTLKFGK